jgi:predicted glycosyltransferase
VDRYPRGMHEELAPALKAHAEQKPGAPVVLGLRDILDEGAVIRDEWGAGRYTEAIRTHYTAVLCYGDRAVYDPIREYELPDVVAERIRFTGYLADELTVSDTARVRRALDAQDRRLAVCTLGGGKDAGAIAHSFLSAMELLRDRGWAGVLIPGPYMSQEDFVRLSGHPAASWVSIIPMVDDVPTYLAAADAAVCMGGYNTSCELLALGVPAVIVPRVKPRREQQMRAERLAARGLVGWLHPGDVADGALAELIEQTSARPRAELTVGLDAIRRHGIHTAARHLAELLPPARSVATLDEEQAAARQSEAVGARG